MQAFELTQLHEFADGSVLQRGAVATTDSQAGADPEGGSIACTAVQGSCCCTVLKGAGSVCSSTQLRFRLRPSSKTVQLSAAKSKGSDVSGAAVCPRKAPLSPHCTRRGE